MHRRCTASACRAELPRHALRCPKCGRATGRVAPPPRASRKPKPPPCAPHPLDAEGDALILRARESLRSLPGRQVRLGDDYFLAVREHNFVHAVKALKAANGCGLREAKAIGDALRKAF